MLNNSVDRAKKALKVTTDQDLADALSVTHSAVGGYRRRDNTLPLIQCLKVVEQTGVSLDWLILGKENQAKSIVDMAWAAVRAADNGHSPAISLVPLYDIPASAGNGYFFDTENVSQYIPLDTQWLNNEGLSIKDLICLPISGDSMTPGLINGDIVLVDRAKQHGDGVFVLRMSEALRIKRLQWLADGTLRISSDNPIYQPEYIDPAKATDDFAIIGACHTKIGRVS